MNEAATLYSQNPSIRAVARELGCSEKKARRLILEGGGKLRPRQKRVVTPALVSQATALYAQNIPVNQIAKTLHCGKDFARKLIITGGMDTTPHGKNRCKNRPKKQLPRCKSCGILLSESGDTFHPNDPPDTEMCWWCREVYA